MKCPRHGVEMEEVHLDRYYCPECDHNWLIHEFRNQRRCVLLTMAPHTHGHTHTVCVSPQASGAYGDGRCRALRQKPEEKREGEKR